MTARDPTDLPGAAGDLRPEPLSRKSRIWLWLFVAVVVVLLIVPILIELLLGGPTDFLTFYAAAQLALDGNLEAAFDGPSLLDRQRATFPRTERLAPFYYPPSYLLLTFWLPALPYAVAQITFLGVTFVLLLIAIRPLLADFDDLVILLAAPAVWINVAHGQNAFLTTALAVLACRCLAKRQARAGAWLGLLSIKPHLCLLWPVLLLAGRRWVTIVAGFVSLAVVIGLSAAIFGTGAWRAFFASALLEAYTNLANSNLALSWMASPYAGLLLLGISESVALSVHLVCALTIIAIIVHLIMLRAAARFVLAVIFVGTLLVTPHSYTYDWVFTLPGLLIVWQRARATGFLPFERAGLVLGYIAPALVAVSKDLDMPFAPLLLLASVATVVRRGYAESGFRRSGQL